MSNELMKQEMNEAIAAGEQALWSLNAAKAQMKEV